MDEMTAFQHALDLAGDNLKSRSGACCSLESDIETIKRWASRSGRVWCTRRLKDLKVVALQILAGNGSQAVQSYAGRKTSYKGNRIPALRIFSILIDCSKGNNWKGVRAVLDVLNVYNVFSGPADDLEEKIKVITSPPTKVLSDSEIAQLKARIVKTFPLVKRRRPWSVNFSGPDIGGARYASEPWKNSSCFEALIPSLSFIPKWIWTSVPKLKGWISSHPYFEKVTRYKTLFAEGRSEPSPYWAGNLAVLGEPGLKTRIVFVGNPWIQGALKPSMVLLQREILKLGTDCTFDQEIGRKFLRETLRAGKKVYSIDLSAATDNFPMFLQRFCGELVGLPGWSLDLLENAGFFDPRKESKDLLVYGKGQPMGLYPSFVLFALTHNIILTMLAKELGLDPLQCFRVLGDDVIITEDSLANEYTKLLEVLGVPVSWNKTFCSATLGEFAGEVCWKGYTVTPIKWRPVQLKSINLVSHYLDRGMVHIDHDNQRIRSIPLCDPEVYPHAEALLTLPKSHGGFGQLTRMKIADRLSWGRRRIRSLRAGYLSLFSDRIHRFLSPQELRGIDVTKFSGLADQQMKFRDLKNVLKERASRTGIPGMMMGAPSSRSEDDIPDSREGLKGLETLAFGKDSLEERLGKYHVWWVIKHGPNPIREMNRIATLAGDAYHSLNVPIATMSDLGKLKLRVRHLPPCQLMELFQAAEERLVLLRNIRSSLKTADSKTVSEFDQGVPWGKVAGIAAATLVNPIGGLLAIGASLVTELPEDKLANLERIMPLLEKE